MYTTTATLALLAYVGLSAAQSCTRQAGGLFKDGSLPVRAPELHQVIAAGSPFTIKWDVSISCTFPLQAQKLML
jgi:hypothetical protein